MTLTPNTKLAAAYGGNADTVSERHRHRYELNDAYVSQLTSRGLIVSGVTPGIDGFGAGLTEAIELPDHPFFVGMQSHPELRSRLLHPHPAVTAFIREALQHSGQRA